MNGPYIDDMVNALKEAGITNVRAANPDNWSSGKGYLDAPTIPFNNHRDMKISDLSEFGTEGEQFNLIGYSHGAVQAAQAAADYADAGGTVDNLVLIGAPINQSFLDNLESNPNIKSVQVIGLAEQNDPVYAGMSDLELIAAAPELYATMKLSDKDKKIGHFYYSGEGPVSNERRRQLAQKLSDLGLK